VGCEGFLELIDREADGALGAREAEALDAHAGACAACRDERQAVRDMEHLLADVHRDHPFGEALVRRAQEQIGHGGAGAVGDGGVAPGRVARLVRWVPAGLAAAAALLLAVLAGRDLVSPPDGGAHPLARAVQAAPIATVEAAGRLAVMRVTRSGGAEGGYVAAGMATPLRAGDRVTVEERTARVRFRDGSEVLVRADTTLEVVRVTPSETVVALADGPGELFASVGPRVATAVFRVETPFSVSEVLGTRFGVRVQGGVATTTVLQGRVRVRSRGTGGTRGLSHLLNAGEQLTLGDGRLAARHVDAASELAWAVASRGAGAPGEVTRRPRPAAPAVSTELLPRRPGADAAGGFFDLPLDAPPSREADEAR
jgi:ferric-dicitrate binding protein FerR (iron transport regulator)